MGNWQKQQSVVWTTAQCCLLWRAVINMNAAFQLPLSHSTNFMWISAREKRAFPGACFINKMSLRASVRQHPENCGADSAQGQGGNRPTLFCYFWQYPGNAHIFHYKCVTGTGSYALPLASW